MQRNVEMLQRTVWLTRPISPILTSMMTNTKSLLLVLTLLSSGFGIQQNSRAASTTLAYTSDGQLQLPADYREWVYLTTGFDMSYNPEGMQMGHHMFDNVFVNREA